MRGRPVKCPNCHVEITIDGLHVADHDVFISYSHRDKAIADAVCAAFESRGIRCWIAPRDIPPGGSWAGTIVDAIAGSRAFVLIHSQSSNTSPQVVRELERAVSKSVVIFPMRIDESALSKDMEYLLAPCHWLMAVAGPVEKHIETLLRSVQAVLAASASGDMGDTRTAAANDSPKPARRSLHRSWIWATAACIVLMAVMASRLLNRWPVRSESTAVPPQPAPAAPVSISKPGTMAITRTDAAKHINLLALVDVERDTVRGQWTVTPEGLVCEPRLFARLRLPYRPPDEYDFRVAFTRLSGTWQVRQCLAAGPGTFGVFVAEGGDMRHGIDAGEEGYKQLKIPFKNGKRFELLTQVRKASITTFIDGAQITHEKLAPNRLQNSPWWEIGQALGVGAQDSRTVFHEIEVTEVTGEGAALVNKAVRFTTPPPPPAPVTPAEAKRIDLLPTIDLSKDVLEGKWKAGRDGLTCTSGWLSRLRVPYQPPDEYDYLIEFTRERGDGPIRQHMVRGNGTFALVCWGEDHFRYSVANAGGRWYPENITTGELNDPLRSGQRYSALVKVRKDGMTVLIDGTVVMRYDADLSKVRVESWQTIGRNILGVGVGDSQATFHRIEVVEVTGAGTVLSDDRPPAAQAK